MAIVDMRDLLYHARDNGYAVGAFYTFGLDLKTLGTVLKTAERVEAPLVLVFSSDEELEMLSPSVESLARGSTMPVGLHAVVGKSEDAVRAIRLGCNSVGLEFGAREAVRSTMATARSCGILGVARLNGRPAEEAVAYAEEVNADLLSVSGWDITPEQVAVLVRDCPRPLIIHDPGNLARGIPAGLAMLCATLAVPPANEAEREVERWLDRLDAAGRGPDVLRTCAPWRNVEHLIVYNVEGATEVEVEEMMGLGQAVLGELPGVREVFTGRAVQTDAGYSYCWLIRFAHRAVIDSYREHPRHKAFADRLFRPRAADRISIDYEAVPPPSGGQADALKRKYRLE